MRYSLSPDRKSRRATSTSLAIVFKDAHGWRFEHGVRRRTARWIVNLDDLATMTRAMTALQYRGWSRDSSEPGQRGGDLRELQTHFGS